MKDLQTTGIYKLKTWPYKRPSFFMTSIGLFKRFICNIKKTMIKYNIGFLKRNKDEKQ